MKDKRLVLALFLMLFLSLLMLYSGLEYNHHNPSLKYILQNFDTFNNTKIYFDGYVSEVDETHHTISIGVPVQPWLLEVKIPITENIPQKGDFVEIYGTLNTKDYVTAEKILVSKSWQKDLIYISSLPAIPLVLYLFFRTWRLNIKKMRFERRKNA